MRSTLACIDLFCGIGGTSMGFAQEDFRVDLGVDIDPATGLHYEFITGSECVESDVADAIGNLDWEHGADRRVLLGCPPCQPFSTLRTRFKGADDRENAVDHMIAVIGRLRPDAVALENVPLFTRSPSCRNLISKLNAWGYAIWADVVDASEYGVPQTRKRFVLLASMHGQPNMARSEEYARPTVHQAIGHLRPISAGCKDADDELHISSALSSLNLERMRHSSPGGSWMQWPTELQPRDRPDGKKTAFGTSYGRMKWDDPAPTVTTRFHAWSSGRYGHPEQDRALSIREGALLQTFPPDFCFACPTTIKTGSRMIGNAVPPKLARSMATAIRETLI